MHSTTYDSTPSRHPGAGLTTYADERIWTMPWQRIHVTAPRDVETRGDTSQQAQSLDFRAQSGEAQPASGVQDTTVENNPKYHCWSSGCDRHDVSVDNGYRSSNVVIGMTMQQPRLHSLCHDEIFQRRPSRTVRNTTQGVASIGAEQST